MENFANLNELVIPMVVIAMPIGIIGEVSGGLRKRRGRVFFSQNGRTTHA
jgi:hypothetical protein